MLRLIFLAALAGFSRASDVLEYTDDDFESRIGGHELILVEFFAPWWVFPQPFSAVSEQIQSWKMLLLAHAFSG